MYKIVLDDENPLAGILASSMFAMFVLFITKPTKM